MPSAAGLVLHPLEIHLVTCNVVATIQVTTGQHLLLFVKTSCYFTSHTICKRLATVRDTPTGAGRGRRRRSCGHGRGGRATATCATAGAAA